MDKHILDHLQHLVEKNGICNHSIQCHNCPIFETSGCYENSAFKKATQILAKNHINQESTNTTDLPIQFFNPFDI